MFTLTMVKSGYLESNGAIPVKSSGMSLRDISDCGVESVLARLVHSYEKTDRSREVEVKPRYYGDHSFNK